MCQGGQDVIVSDSWKGVLRDDGKDALPGSTADQSSVSVASGLLRVAWQLRQRGGPSPTQHLWAGLRQLCSFLVCTAAAGGGLTRGLGGLAYPELSPASTVWEGCIPYIRMTWELQPGGPSLSRKCIPGKVLRSRDPTSLSQ